jgi:hypothetical protein
MWVLKDMINRNRKIPEWWKTFFNNYPFFIQYNSRVNMSCMPWGISFNNTGWNEIFKELCDQLLFLQQMGIVVEFTQVKEKLATARVYYVAHQVRFPRLYYWMRTHIFIPWGNKVYTGNSGETVPFHKQQIRLIQKVENFHSWIQYKETKLTDDIVGSVIDRFTEMSAQTCEVCGEWARVRTSGGWLKTLCEKHMKEMKYKEIEE